MATKTFLSGVFGRSPVRPLQQHMAKVVACVGELVDFFEGAIANDWDRAARARENVSRLENEADAMKTDIRLHLPNSLFMPVARADILDLVTVQDKVANKAKDITGLMTGRRMQIPAGLGDAFVAFVKRAIDAAKQAETTVNELDELFEAGFRGAEVESVESMIRELGRIEKDTDKLQIEIRATLFKMEKDLPPVDVMFLYKIIDWIGDLADHSQRVGARLHLLLAR
ncbi:MAG TPA: TIGR00153 family protein [Gammaproteobacteria bacterium]